MKLKFCILACLAVCLTITMAKLYQPNQNEQPVQTEKEKTSKPTTVIEDFSDEFQSIQGCAVIFDTLNNKYIIYNKDKCKARVSPNSTFKIISALMGIHNKIVTSEDSKLGYDGTSYPIEAWNTDLNLKDAFQTSCVWYFRKIIDKVGKEEVADELKELGYGNCDVSEWNGSNVNPLPELNGFWLESSLLISPMEQVDILHKVIEDKTIYTKSEIETLKNIMSVETNDSEKIYGKTGTGTNGTAWFVGFIEKEKANTYFAVYLDDDPKEAIGKSYFVYPTTYENKLNFKKLSP